MTAHDYILLNSLMPLRFPIDGMLGLVPWEYARDLDMLTRERRILWEYYLGRGVSGQAVRCDAKCARIDRLTAVIHDMQEAYENG